MRPIILLLLLSVAGAAGQTATNKLLPHIIAYSNSTETLKYSRFVRAITITNAEATRYWINGVEHKTNVWAIGAEYDETNLPAATIHHVTYGVGTTVLFTLHGISAFSPKAPTGGWHNADFKYFNHGHVWITQEPQ